MKVLKNDLQVRIIDIFLDTKDIELNHVLKNLKTKANKGIVSLTYIKRISSQRTLMFDDRVKALEERSPYAKAFPKREVRKYK